MKSVCLMAMAAAFAAVTPASAGVILSEGFDDVSTLDSSGWVITNQSSPVGDTDWFQGNEAVFESQAGETNAYIAANYNATLAGGEISNWLITPEFSTATGGVVSFWIRGDAYLNYQDTIRTGFSSGSAATAAFTLSGIQIVPRGEWTQMNVSYAAAGARSTGRFAIDYSGAGDASNFMGVDTFSITAATAAVPEPVTWAMMLVGFGAVGASMRTPAHGGPRSFENEGARSTRARAIRAFVKIRGHYT